MLEEEGKGEVLGWKEKSFWGGSHDESLVRWLLLRKDDPGPEMHSTLNHYS